MSGQTAALVAGIVLMVLIIGAIFGAIAWIDGPRLAAIVFAVTVAFVAVAVGAAMLLAYGITGSLS